MKKIFTLLILVVFVSFSVLGCGSSGGDTQTKSTQGKSSAQSSEKISDDALVYLTVTGAEASSFDLTPDWAPEPNAMAPVDGDMITRWSSDYATGEQWIYFDLGQQSVVSEIVIKWERAYAKDYKILVSDDAQNWKEVYDQTNAAGGTMVAPFDPVKCRYIKVLGVERVNIDWGISIWEAEIYGPAKDNPGSTITKEAYNSKGEDMDKRAEADALVKKLSSKIVPIALNQFQKGVVYTSWMGDEFSSPVSDITLSYLKEKGFNTISIMIPAYQDDLESEVIFTNDTPEGDTPTDEALKHAVETCHKLGMRVMIKPHIDPRTDEARINIMPSDAWFDSYEKFIVRYAKFSQENNVELFSVGTELEATTFSAWTHRWQQVIDKIKEVYSGVLTYSANWTEYKEVPFWGDMEFIGIDAYFPISNSNNPTLEELKDGWEVHANEIEKWLKEKGLMDKGVILTEIGYPSSDGAGRQPWVAVSSVEDQQEQADCLEAMYSVLSKRSWFKGYYIWQYFPQDRWSPLGFTVKGKKSEVVINEWLKK